MDSNALVNDRLACGAKLVEAIRTAGLDITAAFWAKRSDLRDWSLYVASPARDAEGEAERVEAYRTLQAVVARRPELGIDLSDIRFVRASQSMAVAAAEFVNPKPYAGVTRFSGSTLGGMEIDGAYIYPPPRAAVSA